MSLTRVNLNRDLVANDDVNPVRFLGEWAPGEPEGWETFTVMLHGSEAGDIVEVTLADLVEVLKQEGAQTIWWCEPHAVGEPQQASRCWRGVIAADLKERTADCRMVRMILIDGGE